MFMCSSARLHFRVCLRWASLTRQAFGTRADRAYLDNSTTLYGSVRVTNKVRLD
jgi:hypothetical protein